MSGRWFLAPMRLPQAPVQLVCLPYAGAGGSAYRGWAAAFGTDLEVHAVALPGRESRIDDPLELDPAEIAQAIAGRVDRPYVVYGHSLGGRLGFEVLRSLRRSGAPLPQRFYAAACRPPDLKIQDGLYDRIADVPDDELVHKLTVGGAIPAEVLEFPDLVQLLLPVFRSDFRWLDQYEYLDEPPLPVPIVALAAADDPLVSPQQMAGWGRHTSAGFTLHLLSGGRHLFVRDRQREVVDMIRADIRVAVAV
jgi:surfactin synthase thioesterase subunit